MPSTFTATAVALHHARAELRAAPAERQRHRNLMCDTIEGADYPHLVLAEVARRLGRQRAYQVELPVGAVNAAVRQPKLFAGRL